MLTPEEYAKLTGKELTGLDFERTLKASLVLINSKTMEIGRASCRERV